MWYKQVLKPLIARVHRQDQEKAEQFLNQIFQQTRYFTLGEPILAGFLLNLICSLYKYYENLENYSVKLCDFTRDLLGFSLIYIKNFNDEALSSKDFQLNAHMLECLNYPVENTRILMQELYALEINTLIKLDYSMRTDFDFFLKIIDKNEFYPLRNAIQNDFKDLLAFDEGKIFSEFFSKLEKRPATMQPPIRQNNARHPKFLEVKAFWEKGVQNADEQNRRMKI